MHTTLRIPLLAALVASLVAGCGNAASPSEAPHGDTERIATRPLPGAGLAASLTQAHGEHIPGKIPGLDGGTTGDAGSIDAGADAMGATTAGIWREITNAPPFIPDVALLLTDGTIMVHALDDASNWWRLTPDATGSYSNGTWSQLASMPSGYEPLFFASAVLPDGRVVIIGGEYNQGADVETTLGALYDPRLDQWAPISAPSAWTLLGDSPSVVLPDGRFMIGSAGSKQEALFDARTLSWSVTGGGKLDDNAEEGWTLLPSGKVLVIDVLSAPNSELYDPTTGEWRTAGSTGTPLVAPSPIDEIGPAMLLPNGSVFATGANGNTALFSPGGTWTAGPTFPHVAGGVLDIADGPAVLLPSGNVLCVTSEGDYNEGARFFEFDGVALTEVNAIPNAPGDSSFNVFLFLLPTGQALALDGSTDVEIFTPQGSPDPSWAPTITTVASTLTRGATYPLHGTQLNGLSQAVAYGDDYQGATNYPIVRLTNDATGDVLYARTHDHSTMAVATGSADVSTLFDVPSGAEPGASHLVVVANGIPSTSVAVTVQ